MLVELLGGMLVEDVAPLVSDRVPLVVARAAVLVVLALLAVPAGPLAPEAVLQPATAITAKRPPARPTTPGHRLGGLAPPTRLAIPTCDSLAPEVLPCGRMEGPDASF
jgi:hypothetical protein